MAFYPQFPAIYAYPMPFAKQDFYAMYPPGTEPAYPGGPVYFDHPHHAGGMASGPAMGSASTSGRHGMSHHKPGFNNRKESTDSGISDYSIFSSANSRKTSSTSMISNASQVLEEPHLDDVKEEPPYEEPDDDLCEKVVQQVEFYFSDANITKDKFLLKHVKRNKEGFVSLKLISSFKRVKHLTKDWRQVAAAIERKSDKLEVNDLKTKVRRLDALPEYDETTPSRTVVALNLPLERPTIEGVAEIFSACGDIVLIRILRPGNPIPADIKPFANKHPEMTAKVCALVEYERTEFALKAVRQLNNEEEEKMKVMELTAPPPKSTKNKDSNAKKSSKPNSGVSAQQAAPSGPQRRFSHAGFNLPQHQNPDQLVLGPRRRISLLHNMKFSPIDEEQQKKEFALNPNAPTFQMQQQQQHYQQQRRLSRPSFVHSAAHQAAAAAALDMNLQLQMQQAPWMMRRLDIAASGLALPPNVLRMPRGPDKTKGFQRWCKSRMENTAPKKPASRAVPIVAPPPTEKKEEQAKAEEQEPEATVKKEEEQVVPDAEIVEVVEEVVNQAVEGAVGGAVATDSGSDSGHEDGGLSEHELELQDNERSR